MPLAITWLGTTLDNRAITRITRLPRPVSAPGRRLRRRRNPRNRIRLVTQLANAATTANPPKVSAV